MDYNIVFIGQDYQPLDHAVKRVIIQQHEDGIENTADNWPCEGKKDENIKFLRTILETVLKETQKDINDRKLIINKSELREREDKGIKRLYDPTFQDGYFCGVVGVVRRHIKASHISLVEGHNSDIKPDDVFNVKIEIRSRLDKTGEEPGKPYFLSTMLLSGKIDLSDSLIPNSEDEIFDYLLLARFKEQIQRAYLKGYYRSYRRFMNNDDRMKGSFDAGRHIKLNMGQHNGRIAYSFRENTIKNHLNSLIIMAYKRIKAKYPELVYSNFDNEPDLKKIIDCLIYETGYNSEDTKYIIGQNLKSIVHPYYTEYDDLRLTCLRIMRDEGLSIFDADSSNMTNTILFYLPDLWEEYLKRELFNQIENVDPQHSCKSFGYYDGKKWDYNQEIRPDFVFFVDDKKETPYMILDAKFKPGWSGVSKEKKISDMNVMDDYNKCLRDMVTLNVYATGVIFPMEKNGDIGNNHSFLRHRVSESSNAVFYSIPVLVPTVEDQKYSEWRRTFDVDIKNAKECIKQSIKVEKDFSKKVSRIVVR